MVCTTLLKTRKISWIPLALGEMVGELSQRPCVLDERGSHYGTMDRASSRNDVSAWASSVRSH